MWKRVMVMALLLLARRADAVSCSCTVNCYPIFPDGACVKLPAHQWNQATGTGGCAANCEGQCWFCPTPTFTFTPSFTPTPRPTPTRTPTPSFTRTFTPTPTVTPTITPFCETITPTPTSTPTPSLTPTHTPCVGCCQCGGSYPDAFVVNGECDGNCFPGGEIPVGAQCLTPTLTPTPIPTCMGICDCPGPNYPSQFFVPGAPCEGDCLPTPTPIPTCGGCCRCDPTHYPGDFDAAGGLCEGTCLANSIIDPASTPPACVTVTPTPLAADDCCGCSFTSPGTCAQGLAAGTCPDGVLVKGLCSSGICLTATPGLTATPTLTTTPTRTPTDTPFPTGVPTLTFTPTFTVTPVPTGFIGICGITAPTNGNIGGYVAANALCVTATSDSGAHVCSEQDVRDIVAAGNAPALGVGWYAGGSSGTAAFQAQVSDCDGWTTNSPTVNGRAVFWAAPLKEHSKPCVSLVPLYCCCF